MKPLSPEAQIVADMLTHLSAWDVDRDSGREVIHHKNGLRVEGSGPWDATIQANRGSAYLKIPKEDCLQLYTNHFRPAWELIVQREDQRRHQCSEELLSLLKQELAVSRPKTEPQ